MHTPFARSAMNAIENIATNACCKSAAATFCLVLLVGCSALPTPPNRPVSYDFGPGLTSLPAADRRASLPPIALADVEATGLSESSTAVLYRLNYADAQQLRPYTLARWTQPPVQLVQQALRAQLGLRRPVLQDADAAAQARDTARGGKLPAVLRIELEEFSHLFTSPAESTGLLRLRATLVDPTPAGETLLGQRVFIVQKPAPTPDAAGGTRALADAAGQGGGEWGEGVVVGGGGGGAFACAGRAQCSGGHEAQVGGVVRSAKVAQVGQHARQFGVAHTKPCGQDGRVLVYRGAGQQAALAHVPLVVGVGGVGDAHRWRLAIERPAFDGAAHHEVVGGPTLVRSGAGGG